MKLALTSDLHYGFNSKTDSKFRKFIKKLSKEIKEQEVKALIIAGDTVSTKQRNLKRALEIIRADISIPILLVNGNHCFWNADDNKYSKQNFNTLEDIYRYQAQVLKENNVHHLDIPYIINDVVITGFDGWYASTNPPTNDIVWVPNATESGDDVMSYLTRKAWSDFGTILDMDLTKYRKSILVTHHNITPYKGGSHHDNGMNGPYAFYEEAKHKFDILCYGHTHVFEDKVDGRIRRLNAGSDYNDPKYIIFDV